MSASELQDWLFDVAMRDELGQLAVATALQELDNTTPDPSLATIKFDWDRLILGASVLARSTKRSHREASLRVATGALLQELGPAVSDAAAVLLGQLSNHRAAALAERRGRIAPGLSSRLGTSLRLEHLRQKLETSILLDATGERLSVNEFQLKFWSAARGESWLSASAPTASGKTFLVLRWLVDTLLGPDQRRAIYLAPTRALVSEIEYSLTALAAQLDQKVTVSSLPSREKYAQEGKTIFVFTQERLHLFANLISDGPQIDLLVVDEAHKIGDEQRGVILQDAIERLVRVNPGLRVVFVSPATQNPEVLLEDAPSGTPVVAVDSDVPTVLQNVVVAQQVPKKPKNWFLQLVHGDDRLPIGVLQLGSKPETLQKRLAYIAAAVGERGGTLVYVSGASEAEEVSLLLSQLVKQPEIIDPELLELADLARRGVHKSYRLAPVAEKGVAFHYGNMPSLLRMEIERLFRSGKLKFLVCTSTLIEGVNLSCRTIVTRAPKKGKHRPMEAQDFWNLAGRAGRWGDEFQGNIVCIDAQDPKAWPSGIPERTRYPIQRETDAVLSQVDELLTYLQASTAAILQDNPSAATLEPVSAYLVATYLREGTLLNEPLSRRHPASDVERIESALRQVVGQVTLPAEIGIRNPGVSLIGLQRLLDFFRAYRGPVEDLLAAPPESEDAYETFAIMMERVNAFVFHAFKPVEAIPLHALIVLQWLKGLSLPTMIRKRIEYLTKRGDAVDSAKVIRTTLDLIENVARFRAPKYFSAYNDVLNYHLKEIGRSDLIADDIDIGVALEFGVSSVTLRSLMELGMSRMGAVALYEKIAMDNLDISACIKWVSERRELLDDMSLPAAIVREIRDSLLT